MAFAILNFHGLMQNGWIAKIKYSHKIKNLQYILHVYLARFKFEIREVLALWAARSQNDQRMFTWNVWSENDRFWKHVLLQKNNVLLFTKPLWHFTFSTGIVSQSFMLSDQPNYGNWSIQVDGYVSTWKHLSLSKSIWNYELNISEKKIWLIWLLKNG